MHPHMPGVPLHCIHYPGSVTTQPNIGLSRLTHIHKSNKPCSIMVSDLLVRGGAASNVVGRIAGCHLTTGDAEGKVVAMGCLLNIFWIRMKGHQGASSCLASDMWVIVNMGLC